ncbi:MAG: DUF4375 domain-containing protein [Chitinophagaceae bacterium]
MNKHLRICSISFLICLLFSACNNSTNDTPTITEADSIEAKPLTPTDTVAAKPSTKEFRSHINSKAVLTAAELDTTDDKRLEDKILYNIYSKLNESLDNDAAVIPTLSRPRQVIYYIYEMEGEVNNGGFDQYFLNSKGKSSKTTIDALKEINALKFSSLLIQAESIFKSSDKTGDQKQELYSKLDQEFYALYKTEDISSLKVKYIRDNIQRLVDK